MTGHPLTEAVKLADDDLLYLVKLADWAAGQGFCQIDGIEDPEEWCFRKWSELGPPNGDGYSAEALAEKVILAGSIISRALRQPPLLPSGDEVRRQALEEAAKVADDQAQRCRDIIATCPKWSPVQGEWSRARDACLDTADAIRALSPKDQSNGLSVGGGG